MLFNQPITLRSVIRLSPIKVMFTWLMVLAENVFMILLPLFIGFAIDGVLKQNLQPLFMFAAILFVLVVITVARRFYDTRVYGGIRVRLSNLVERNLRGQSVSVKDARLSMSRELVDFLEEDLPSLITAVVQLVATVVILATFHIKLALCVLIAGLSMMLIYALFHQTFTRLNGALNDQLEQQVRVLSGQSFAAIRTHFERLKRCEIKLSDTEALVYGLIFIVLFAGVLTNLWMVSILTDPTVGQVFSIVTYSLEFVETAVMLPITLQTLSRLMEISQRLNQTPAQLAVEEKPYEI
ncbi:ABC transporter six-transmembrane domain-containing protein [Vibrio coralliilyticus]|uniref:ABC transporter six-transmembrane domain-containing protein n=1 Tax=Vibrio coralliilyticus TaxID=190893 RepID=UPI001E5B8756|nr:ABC transporter six-transmembrane domain-containing protein [Vibrio coralliilyticus]MCC2520791.1 ABC transporter six-transmembrane domain-containing protein [Vibrio coralliilyticus]